VVNYIKDYASRLTKDKAYIIGVLCGDACLKSNRYQIKLSILWKDKEFAEKFTDCFYNVYGIRRRPTKEKRFKNGHKSLYANVTIDSKPAYSDIIQYGRFSTFTWRIPEQIINAHREIKKAFLQGYFDSDGSIDVKWHAVTADSANHNGLNQIVNLLKSFDVNASIYPCRRKNKTYYHLKICNWYNLTKFKEVGFSLLRKQKNLLLTLKNYKHKLYRHSKKIYLLKKRSKYTYNDVLKEVKKERIVSSESLSQLLGVCRRQAVFYINKFSSQGVLIPLVSSVDRRRKEWRYAE